MKYLKVVARLAMIYGTWTVKKVEEKKLDLVKMRMLRWMRGA